MSYHIGQGKKRDRLKTKHGERFVSKKIRLRSEKKPTSVGTKQIIVINCLRAAAAGDRIVEVMRVCVKRVIWPVSNVYNTDAGRMWWSCLNQRRRYGDDDGRATLWSTLRQVVSLTMANGKNVHRSEEVVERRGGNTEEEWWTFWYATVFSIKLTGNGRYAPSQENVKRRKTYVHKRR